MGRSPKKTNHKTNSNESELNEIELIESELIESEVISKQAKPRGKKEETNLLKVMTTATT